MPIRGERINLREIRKEDLQDILDLRNNIDGSSIARNVPPTSTYEEFLNSHNKSELSFDREYGFFAIETNDTKEFVGRMTFSYMGPRFCADIGIGIKESFWGKGYGHEAHELLLKFLFHNMGLQMVNWRTWSENHGSLKLAIKSGYTITVRSREAIFIDGKLCDYIGLQILREEYYERHPELVDNLQKI
ncbi:MAG: GNAT family N-acetyltransferase [Candidatus Heimdallarchaeota archaeon]|nr:GNAT family N-acetyltransferase [Candidatus Heimdallarchaeota archaeon]MDH5645340.1 GNAT family N-acetyltransferase [Candidatus Heimdallarchaeota archaeon]